LSLEINLIFFFFFFTIELYHQGHVHTWSTTPIHNCVSNTCDTNVIGKVKTSPNIVWFLNYWKCSHARLYTHLVYKLERWNIYFMHLNHFLFLFIIKHFSQTTRIKFELFNPWYFQKLMAFQIFKSLNLRISNTHLCEVLDLKINKTTWCRSHGNMHGILHSRILLPCNPS
jgi:hypothetical protein